MKAMQVAGHHREYSRREPPPVVNVPIPMIFFSEKQYRVCLPLAGTWQFRGRGTALRLGRFGYLAVLLPQNCIALARAGHKTWNPTPFARVVVLVFIVHYSTNIRFICTGGGNFNV